MPETNLEKLNLNDILLGTAKTKEEFYNAIKTVVDVMKKMREAVNKDIAKVQDQSDQNDAKLTASIDYIEKMCGDMKGEMAEKDSFETLQNFVNDLSSEFEQLRADMPTFPIDEIQSRISGIYEKINSFKQTPEQVRDGLMSLEGESRLPITAIQGAEEFMKAAKGKDNSGNRNVVRPKIRTYSLSSQCDGNTKAFTLPLKTTNILGVFGTEFPVNFDVANDWTFVGRTLTLGDSVSAPATGQTLWALIETL